MKQPKLTTIVSITLVVFALIGFKSSTADPASRDLVMTNAYDAFGSKRSGLTHDFGFCAVVQYGQKTIMFDAGTDAATLEQNLKSLGIDARDVDVAIASHGHHDHIGGFDYLLSVNPEVKIYLPKDFFSFGAPIQFPLDGREPDVVGKLPEAQRYYSGEHGGREIRSSGRFWKANVEYVTEAREIMPGVTLIPTTSELIGTFIKYPPFGEQPRLLGLPELTVSFASEKGEVLITGCSHSTLEAIVKKARETLKRPIHLVSGGFHLLPYDRKYIEDLASRMQDDFGVETVAPAHCTGHLAFSIFQEAFGDDYRFFGLGETIIVGK